jgi:hypothetical protein
VVFSPSTVIWLLLDCTKDLSMCLHLNKYSSYS